jgi:hypothetical protein
MQASLAEIKVGGVGRSGAGGGSQSDRHLLPYQFEGCR